MTISITTTLSFEPTNPALLQILMRLHQNKLGNLHISCNENKKLIIHTEDETLERGVMRLIDTDKTKAITHFQNTYFSGVSCEITSVERFAFLPRITTSFVSLVESAFKKLPGEAQHADSLFVLERMRNVNARQAFAVSSASLSHSDSDDEGLFENNALHGADPFHYHHVSAVTDASSSNWAHTRGLQTPLHTRTTTDVERSNRAIIRKTEMDWAQKSEKQKQNMIYEAQLVSLYHASVAGTSAATSKFSDCESQILQIPHPDQAVSREATDSQQVGVTLRFTPTQQSHENLIMRDIDSITRKFLEETNLNLSIMQRFLRDAIGRIINFEITFMGLCVAPRSFVKFLYEVKKSLYLTGTEAHYRFSGFTLTVPLQRQQVVTGPVSKPEASVGVATSPALFATPANNNTSGVQPNQSTANRV